MNKIQIEHIYLGINHAHFRSFLREVQCHKIVDGNVLSVSVQKKSDAGEHKQFSLSYDVHGNNVTSNPRRVTKRV